MTVNHEKRKQLLSIRKKIINMPNNAQKMCTIDGYAGLLDYYQIIFRPNKQEIKSFDIDDNLLDKYYKRIRVCTEKKIDDLEELASELYMKLDILIKYYQENNFYSHEYIKYQKVNSKEMYDLISEFFKILGQDVCDLFGKIVSNDNVSLADLHDCDGFSTNSIFVDSPCMVLKNIESYADYFFTLTHEVGHCYQYYLQRNHQHLENFNPFMEVTSLLFEKMFLAFLESKKIYQEVINNKELFNHIYILNDLVASRLLCELIMKKDITSINMYTLNYQSSIPEKELEKKMISECGYIMKNKKEFTFHSIDYAIGEIISSYFINKMQDDFPKAWQEYKDFICTVDDYPLKEILDKYIDIDLMQGNIKKFIKSYQSR